MNPKKLRKLIVTEKLTDKQVEKIAKSVKDPRKFMTDLHDDTRYMEDLLYANLGKLSEKLNTPIFKELNNDRRT